MAIKRFVIQNWITRIKPVLALNTNKKMTKRKTIRLGLLSVCAICIVFAMSRSKNISEIQPNIVFILADDHATHAISSYGGLYENVAPTPNIDRIGKEGARFNKVYYTNSRSGSSRTTILTGKNSYKNEFYENKSKNLSDGSQLTFPKQLNNAGYKTAIIGKWHLRGKPAGFDYYKYHELNGELGSYWDPVYNDNGVKVQEKGYATNLTTEIAMQWLSTISDKSKPFCLLLQFNAPHRPWQPDSIYQDLFTDKEIPYPSTFNDDYKGREKTAGVSKMTIKNHLNRRDLKQTPPDGLSAKKLIKWERYGDNGEFALPADSLTGQALKEWKYQCYIKDYLACVKSVDDNIGRLLSYLDENGLSENTIVIYSSDQGNYLGDHGWYDKGFMYEESLRLPLLIRYPKKVKPGQIIDEIVLNIDYAPTILDLAKVSIPKDMQGKSFLPFLNGNHIKDWRKSMYYHYSEYPKWHNIHPHYGIRTDRYKLIRFYYPVDVWELYDLNKDPNELTNLYNNPEYEDLIRNLKQKLQDQRKLYDDNVSLNQIVEMIDSKVAEK